MADQNDEDTRTFCGKFLYNAIASTDNAQHKNCPSRDIDDRPGVEEIAHFSTAHPWSSTRLFRWDGSRQHDRTPTKIAFALENFPATVIMPSTWPDWSKFQFLRSCVTPTVKACATPTVKTRSCKEWGKSSGDYPVVYSPLIVLYGCDFLQMWLICSADLFARFGLFAQCIGTAPCEIRVLSA